MKLKTSKWFRFNWNLKIFPLSIFKKMYDEMSSKDCTLYWRHTMKEIPAETPCILWLGTKGVTKESKKLQGIVGIGKVVDNKKYQFDSCSAPWYLKELKDIGPKRPLSDMVFAKIQLIATTEEAFVSSETIKYTFKKDVFWISGYGKSSFIKEDKNLNDLIELVMEEVKSRRSRAS